MSLLQKTDQVELKVRQLSSKLDRLARENAELGEENDKLKAERDRQTGVLEALKNKLERSQDDLTERESSTPTPQGDLRQQIDHYLREIDKCIEWLSRQ